MVLRAAVKVSGHCPLGTVLEGPMSIYLIAFIVLMVAWIYGWIGFHVTGGLIHILPVFAVVLLVLHFVRGRHGEADLRITRSSPNISGSAISRGSPAHQA